MAEYEQLDVELEPGDCLLSYTDALIESRDANGEKLGEEGLLRIVRLLGDVEPDRLIEAVVKEIADRYPENLSADDVTLLVLRANGTERRHAFQDMLRAQMRMIGSLIRAQSQSRAAALARRKPREYRRRHYSRARPPLARAERCRNARSGM